MKLYQIEDIIDAVAEGNRIQAIKLARGATNLGLKDAKDLIDRWFPLKGWGVHDPDGFRRAMADDLKEALIAEFRSLHDRMQVLVAQFAELVDDAPPLIKECDPELDRLLDEEEQIARLRAIRQGKYVGDWRTLRPGDSVKYQGLWRRVTAVEGHDFYAREVDNPYLGDMPVCLSVDGCDNWPLDIDWRTVEAVYNNE